MPPSICWLSAIDIPQKQKRFYDGLVIVAGNEATNKRSVMACKKKKGKGK